MLVTSRPVKLVILMSFLLRVIVMLPFMSRSTMVLKLMLWVKWPLELSVTLIWVQQIRNWILVLIWASVSPVNLPLVTDVFILELRVFPVPLLLHSILSLLLAQLHPFFFKFSLRLLPLLLLLLELKLLLPHLHPFFIKFRLRQWHLPLLRLPLLLLFEPVFSLLFLHLSPFLFHLERLFSTLLLELELFFSLFLFVFLFINGILLRIILPF